MRDWAIVLLVALCICVTVCATIDRILTTRRLTDEIKAVVSVLRVHEIVEQDAVRRLREDLDAIKKNEAGLLEDMIDFRDYLDDLECRMLEAIDGQGHYQAGGTERRVGSHPQD